MAGQPLVQLDLQLRLQDFRIRARTNPPDQIEPGEPWILEARSGPGNHRFGSQRQPEVGHTRAVDLCSEKARCGDPYNREWMAIDLVGCARNGWIGSILRLPDSETHYGYRGCAFLVIGIDEETPTPGRNAKGLEEISGDVLAVARLNRGRRPSAPHCQVGVCFTDLECGQVLECGRVCA